MAKNRPVDEPILWAFKKDEKVKIIVDVMKTSKESDEKGNFSKEPVTKEKPGKIHSMFRTYKTHINSQGVKRKAFQYYYSVKLDNGGVIDKLEESQIKKAA
jgi:hypothetical protein